MMVVMITMIVMMVIAVCVSMFATGALTTRHAVRVRMPARRQSQHERPDGNQQAGGGLADSRRHDSVANKSGNGLIIAIELQ